MANKPRTALIIGHVQAPITQRPADPEGYLANLSGCLSEARAAEVPVIYAVLSYRSGYVELPADSRLRRMMESARMFVTGESDHIHETVEPQEGDIVVQCTRVSAFAYTALDPILRSLGVTSLALAGISTGGVILGTLVDARNRDYEVTVLEDLCVQRGGQDELLGVFKEPWMARVVPSRKWLAELV
jgi:nicotinamidase-related amidase